MGICPCARAGFLVLPAARQLSSGWECGKRGYTWEIGQIITCKAEWRVQTGRKCSFAAQSCLKKRG